jgi:hypothetical protein
MTIKLRLEESDDEENYYQCTDNSITYFPGVYEFEDKNLASSLFHSERWVKVDEDDDRDRDTSGQFTGDSEDGDESPTDEEETDDSE